MHHHEIRKGSYNEVILDPTQWGSSTTQAFYFVKHDDDPGAEGYAKDVHRRFKEYYGPNAAVPLVRLELEPEHGRPAVTRG